MRAKPSEARRARRASLASQGEGAYCERSRAKRGELAELASLRKARELSVEVIEETKLAHISKTKHFRHMMYRTRNDYFHPYYRYP